MSVVEKPEKSSVPVLSLKRRRTDSIVLPPLKRNTESQHLSPSTTQSRTGSLIRRESEVQSSQIAQNPVSVSTGVNTTANVRQTCADIIEYQKRYYRLNKDTLSKRRRTMFLTRKLENLESKNQVAQAQIAATKIELDSISNTTRIY